MLTNLLGNSYMSDFFCKYVTYTENYIGSVVGILAWSVHIITIRAYMQETYTLVCSIGTVATLPPQ